MFIWKNPVKYNNNEADLVLPELFLKKAIKGIIKWCTSTTRIAEQINGKR